MCIDVTLGTLIYYLLIDPEIEDVLSPDTISAMWTFAWACWFCPGSMILYVPGLKMAWEFRSFAPITCWGWTGYCMFGLCFAVLVVAVLGFFMILSVYDEFSLYQDLVTYFWFVIVEWIFLSFYAYSEYKRYSKMAADAAAGAALAGDATSSDTYGSSTAEGV